MFEFNLIFIKHKLQQDWRISCLYWKPQISRRAGLRRDKEQHERSVETYYNFRACIGFVMFYDVFSYHTNLVRQDVSLHWENKSRVTLMSTNLDRQHSRDAGVSQRTGQTTYYHTIKISQKADGCAFLYPSLCHNSAHMERLQSRPILLMWEQPKPGLITSPNKSPDLCMSSLTFYTS